MVFLSQIEERSLHDNIEETLAVGCMIRMSKVDVSCVRECKKVICCSEICWLLIVVSIVSNTAIDEAKA